MDVQPLFDVCRFQRIGNGNVLTTSLFFDSGRMDFGMPIGSRRDSRAISEQEAWREIGRFVPRDLHRHLGVKVLQPIPLPPMPPQVPQLVNPDYTQWPLPCPGVEEAQHAVEPDLVSSPPSERQHETRAAHDVCGISEFAIQMQRAMCHWLAWPWSLHLMVQVGLGKLVMSPTASTFTSVHSRFKCHWNCPWEWSFSCCWHWLSGGHGGAIGREWRVWRRRLTSVQSERNPSRNRSKSFRSVLVERLTRVNHEEIQTALRCTNEMSCVSPSRESQSSSQNIKENHMFGTHARAYQRPSALDGFVSSRCASSAFKTVTASSCSDSDGSSSSSIRPLQAYQFVAEAYLSGSPDGHATVPHQIVQGLRGLQAVASKTCMPVAAPMATSSKCFWHCCGSTPISSGASSASGERRGFRNNSKHIIREGLFQWNCSCVQLRLHLRWDWEISSRLVPTVCSQCCRVSVSLLCCDPQSCSIFVREMLAFSNRRMAWLQFGLLVVRSPLYSWSCAICVARR